MRRSMAMAVGAAVVLVSVGAGTTAAIGASGSSSAKTQARHIAASLTTAAGRAHYGLSDGRLVSADVCVRGACVHRDYSSATACPAGAACIGTALVARKFANGVSIAAELA
jgi:hypothetical protein